MHKLSDVSIFEGETLDDHQVNLLWSSSCKGNLIYHEQ